MDIADLVTLIHPAITVAIVFPLIGIVVNRAWNTRQRRLQTTIEGKSKIPLVVGQEHVQLGRWLAISVVGVTLIGLAVPIFNHILEKQVSSTNLEQVVFIILMFAAAIASLFFLYKVNTPLWRGVFATLTGMALVVLGLQEGVYRRDSEWYLSHFYFGMIAAMLMIFSVAIIQDIYQDRSNRWRYVHIILNSIALLLFIAQAMTGTRDLLDIPPNWQKPYVYKCDFANKTCFTPAPPTKF